MPGSLSVRKKNDKGVSPFSIPNAARTLFQGATYAYGDEIEAYLRTLLSRDPNAYQREVARIRGELDRYASSNPKAALALEGAGMIGSAMLTPELAALKGAGMLSRINPNVVKYGLGLVDDAAQGALYASGQAENTKDIPKTIAEEGPANAAFYTGMSGAEAAGKKALSKAASTRPGYNMMMRLRRRYMGY